MQQHVDWQRQLKIVLLVLLFRINLPQLSLTIILSTKLSSLYWSPVASTHVKHFVGSLALFVYQPPKEIDLALQKRAHRYEMALESDLLAYSRLYHEHVFTMDPVEADFYWVPHSLIGHWIGCYETNTSRELQTCDAPTGQRWESGKDYWNRALRPFLSHIVYGLPFFNASNGEDHLFLYTSGNGPICESAALFHASFLSDAFFKWVVHRMLIIGSHGTYDMKIPIGPDTTYSTHRSSRDRKTCFRPGFDIALPQYRPSFNNRDGESELHDCLDSRACSEWVQFLRAKAARIRHAFYFKGSFRQLLGWCSPGIRSYLKGFCSPQNSCTTTRLGGIFALAPAGTACWSMRFFDAISELAIPVIMADIIVEPFEQFLDYTMFTAKIETHSLVGKCGQESKQREARRLRELATLFANFRRTCAASQLDACASHAVSRKLAALVQVRPWLTSPPGFVKLFLLELACRSRKSIDFVGVCDLSKSVRVALKGSFR